MGFNVFNVFNLFKKKLTEVDLIPEEESGFDPERFIAELKNKMNVKRGVKLQLNANDKDSCNIAHHDETSSLIEVGTLGYDFSNLTEHQLVKIKNTLYHEMVHVREREQLPSVLTKELFNGKRTLALFGYKLLNDYTAYLEANEIYPESPEDMHSSPEKFLFVFYDHLTKGKLFIDKNNPCRSESDEWRFFDAFCDYCIGLIALYIVCGGINKDEFAYSKFNKAVEQLSSYYPGREGLTYDDYAKIGKEYIDTIIYDLSSSERRIFWDNTGIIYQ